MGRHRLLRAKRDGQNVINHKVISCGSKAELEVRAKRLNKRLDFHGDVWFVVEEMANDGYCALCGGKATHVCHCDECENALVEDGGDPAAGRAMCDGCDGHISKAEKGGGA